MPSYWYLTTPVRPLITFKSLEGQRLANKASGSGKQHVSCVGLVFSACGQAPKVGDQAKRVESEASGAEVAELGQGAK